MQQYTNQASDNERTTGGHCKATVRSDSSDFAGPRLMAQGTELGTKQLWFASIELLQRLDLRIETDLNILHK
jgi:hypothetical protein